MNSISWHHLYTFNAIWVDQLFFLHDTLISLLDTFPLEAKFLGSALERAGSLQGACRVTVLGVDKHHLASINQSVLWQLTAATKVNLNSWEGFLLHPQRGSVWWAAKSRWVSLWKVKVFAAQSCPTLCDPMDCSPPGSFVCGSFQARILECVAIPFSRGSFWARD